MSDHDATVQSLRELVAEFVRERDWHRFHTPKNLASSMAIEVAELMEHFQWLTPEESIQVKTQPQKLAEIAEEISDVLAYTLAIANVLEIDLAESLTQKMVKNRQKYPVEQSRNWNPA